MLLDGVCPCQRLSVPIVDKMDLPTI